MDNNLNDNDNMKELEEIFKIHLEKQYKLGYVKGLETGSKTFIAAIKNMIKNEHANIEAVLNFCNQALGEN